MCKELDRLWSEQVGEVVLFIWISFLQDQLIEFLNIASPLILRHVIKNTTQITLKNTRSVECRKNKLHHHRVFPSSVHGPSSWPLCSELYRSRCRTDTTNSHVTDSENSHSATGDNEMDAPIVGK